ncbi:C1D-domain-containing protein [Fomitiporia mediterranea MF3/22]|uniref:C1D-domain-containing protein n=1 Tax=Fomitiporia mediterranea (strain MF3/22) TaxID=694068 RepID=UPI0004409319|nr:C1D-domain-containing protein [Fomitiporia mediterranea MF3/22]EJD03743.1 C1D-domain-containing protein [Fomitiporia mediterranea MF3/22]
MSANMKKQIAKVNALSHSLDELEKTLEPLLSKPLPDTLSSLDTLQQAKLQVVLPYLINDLVFIYLKTRGIDPKTHPVVAELDRVRQYFGKIKDAEESNKKRTTEVDKAAAGRFIKHAISEARQSATAAAQPKASEAGPSNAPSQQSPPSTSAHAPIRVTDKMREREEYQRRLAEESDSEEPNLEVIDDVTEEKISEVTVKKGKGKEVVNLEAEVTQTAQELSEVQPESHKRKKRKRPMDPFGPNEDAPTPSPNDKPKKGKKKKKTTSAIDTDAAADSRANSDPDAPKKESKSKLKKVKG